MAVATTHPLTSLVQQIVCRTIDNEQLNWTLLTEMTLLQGRLGLGSFEAMEKDGLPFHTQTGHSREKECSGSMQS